MPRHQARAIQMSLPTGLLGKQVLDRVDDRRDRLVLSEDAHGTRHGVRGDESRTDERQEDQRVGESAGTVHGLR